METDNVTQYAIGDNPCTLGPNSVATIDLLLDRHPKFTGSVASATVSVSRTDGTAVNGTLAVSNVTTGTNYVRAKYTSTAATIGTYYTISHRVTLANGDVISIESAMAISSQG